MQIGRTIFKQKQLDLALERLELLAAHESSEILGALPPQQAVHVPELSRKLAQSPFKTKQQLEQLKLAGFVHSPKQYPHGYAINNLKQLRVRLKVAQVVENL
jgi:hypothetical protein